VDLMQLDPNDMIIDAVSAVNFLRNNYADKIDPEAISLIGHSQGCTVAAYTAARIPVKKVVQLMGTGVSLDKILLKQIQALIEVYQTGFDICQATNGNPQYVVIFKDQVISNSIQLADATYWLSLIYNGSLSNNTIIPLGGVTVKYWIDLIQWGDFNVLYQTMTKAAVNTPFLAINSPSDNQVWPEFYESVHAIILSLPNSKISIIQNLSHLLIDSSLSSNLISTEVVDIVSSFIFS